MLVLVDRARYERLGDLVRSLLPEHPGLQVHTQARRILEVPLGSTLVLAPSTNDADWLNIQRPLFAALALKVVLFCDEATSAMLARQAVDFFDWISHRVECPSAPPHHAVAGIRCALVARAPGIVWAEGQLDEAFSAARPGRTLLRLSAAKPYAELVAAVREQRHSWLAWTDVDGPFRLQRVRWALAEGGRQGRAFLVAPAVESPGWWRLHDRTLELGEAIKRLEQAGARAGGRLAALCDLEPEAIELLSELLARGHDEAEAAAKLLQARDPGAELARWGADLGLVTKPTAGGGETPPTLRAFSRDREHHRRELERIGLKLERGEAVDVKEIAWWAAEARHGPPAEVAARYGARRRGHIAEVVLRSRAMTGETWRTLADWALGAGDSEVAADWLRHAAGATFVEDFNPWGWPTLGEKALQAKSAEYDAILSKLSELRESTARSAEKEVLLRRLLILMEDELGTEHPAYLKTLNELASALEAQRKHAEAEGVLRHSLATQAKILRPEMSGALLLYAASLLSLGIVLASMGRLQEAFAVTQEAVDRYRALAQRHPDAFLPDLAESLNNLGAHLSALGHSTEALTSVEEALNTLWPFFERLPAAFANLARKMLHQSQALHASLGKPLPPTLVERLATFERLTHS